MKKLLVVFLGLAMFVACDKDGDGDENDTMYVNGMYKAEMSDFSHDWKEFLEITISEDKVTVANVDAVNEAGEMKSALTEYPMPDPPGLPSVWYPQLEDQFVAANIVNNEDVDGVSGATGTSTNMNGMFDLILVAAKTGDTSVQILPVE